MGSTTNFAWTWPDPGDPADGSGDFQTLAGQIDATLGNAWTSYTPLWEGTVNPAIGNGTITGAYKQWGKTALVLIRVDIGTTTTFGSGSYSFSLPPGMSMATGHTTGGGWAVVSDASTTFYSCSIGIVAGDSTKLRVRSDGGGNINATSPITFAATDSIIVRVESAIT